MQLTINEDIAKGNFKIDHHKQLGKKDNIETVQGNCVLRNTVLDMERRGEGGGVATLSAETRKNEIGKYAAKMMKNPIAFTDSQLSEDYKLLVSGHAFYLPQFFCGDVDYSYLTTLTNELKQDPSDKMTNWSKHFKHENPDFSQTFREIIQNMSNYFDVEIYASRLNFYPDSSAWKPFHHDSHAYGGKGKKEDFTVGASFGASRELVFLHPPSKSTFGFPQVNGDIFAFDTRINQVFQHGVPKANMRTGPRFSIIAWGRRRSLNIRNGGTEEVNFDRVLNSSAIAYSPPNHSKQSPDNEKNNTPTPNPNNNKKKEVKVELEQVTQLVEQFVLSKKPAPTTKSPPLSSDEPNNPTSADGPQRKKRTGNNRNQRVISG